MNRIRAASCNYDKARRRGKQGTIDHRDMIGVDNRPAGDCDVLVRRRRRAILGRRRLRSTVWFCLQPYI